MFVSRTHIVHVSFVSSILKRRFLFRLLSLLCSRLVLCRLMEVDSERETEEPQSCFRKQAKQSKATATEANEAPRLSSEEEDILRPKSTFVQYGSRGRSRREKKKFWLLPIPYVPCFLLAYVDGRREKKGLIRFLHVCSTM